MNQRDQINPEAYKGFVWILLSDIGVSDSSTVETLPEPNTAGSVQPTT